MYALYYSGGDKMRTIVVFSGAGLSAESGIDTFRAVDGLWEKHKIEDVASPEGWERDKEMVLRFYAERFQGVKNAEPNEAHKSIARLEEKFNVINITQNVDDLLERAGCTNVQHVHGKLNERKCEWHHNISNLDGDTQFACDYLVEQTEPVNLGELCPKCNGQMRPNVVWFKEAVDLGYDRIVDLVREVKYGNGVFICIGTSANVAPASLLIPFFSQVMNKYIINSKTWKISDYTLLEGQATEQMSKLAEELLNPSVSS